MITHYWGLMMNKAYVVQSQGKVAYIQPHIHGKQPFILIIQDQWMLAMCNRLSYNSGWAIDATFKTNQFEVPLYAAVDPNKQAMCIPLWYMICSCDEYRHEQYALEVTLKVIFERMDDVRTNELVIDKLNLELNAITNVIKLDLKCWCYMRNFRN